MNGRHNAEGDQSAGFTLVEVLIVVLLIGVLATALTASFVVFVRTDDSVVNRLTNSNDLQILESFFPGDVASARFVADGSAANAFDTGSACYLGLPATGTALLQLNWDQRWRNSVQTEYEVIYYLPAGVNQIVRRSCVDGTGEEHTVARHFDSAVTPVVVLTTGPVGIDTVEVVLSYDDDDRRIAASSRNIGLTP